MLEIAVLVEIIREKAPDRSLDRVVALSADRWSMLLRERPIAAIGERRDPRVLDATTWRVSWRRK